MDLQMSKLSMKLHEHSNQEYRIEQPMMKNMLSRQNLQMNKRGTFLLEDKNQQHNSRLLLRSHRSIC